MEDPKRETWRDADLDGLEGDELDLSLGLCPTASRHQLHLSNPKNTMEKPAEEAVVEVPRDLNLTVPIWETGEIVAEQDPNRVGFPEPQARKEEQALRRHEARKKRDEKRKLKPNGLNGNANEERLLWFEKQRAMARERNEREGEGDFSERRRKGENCNSNGVDGAKTAMPFLARPAGGNNINQFNGLPYVMMPGLVGSDRNGFQPVVGNGSAGGFRPYQVAEKDSGHGGGGGDNGKRLVPSCSRGSSPGVSDYQSTSDQGGSSSDGASHSSHSPTVDLAITNGSTMSNGTQAQTSHRRSQPPAPHPNGFVLPGSLNGKAQCTSSSHHMESSETLNNAPNTKRCHLEPNSDLQTQTSQDKNPTLANRTQSLCPGTNQAKEADPSNEAALLSQMPCVSARGNGPNAKTTTGFLYRYTKSEVSIVCVCHGISFSPAGFVEHAGGVDIENPLRHITVVPFAFS